MCDQFFYTSHGEVIDIDPNKPAMESGFYHPIRIIGNDLDELDSRLALIQKQKLSSLKDDTEKTLTLLIDKHREIEEKYLAVQ
ncbi:hypothetical protein D3C85_1818630 [compost metagenome]